MQWFKVHVSQGRIYVWNVANASFCYDGNGNIVKFDSVSDAEAYASERERGWSRIGPVPASAKE